MITIYKKNNAIVQTNQRPNEIELRGLSTDTKPTAQDNKDITNGTIFLEIDTGNIYLYNSESNQWEEI